MFEKTACDQCGTALLPGARFCRQCGKPATGHAHGASVTEATTRTLNAPLPYEAPPQYGDVRLSPHAHGELSHAHDTTALEKEHRKTRKTKLPVILLLLLLPIVAFGMILAYRAATAPRRIVIMQREGGPQMPPPVPDMGAPQVDVPVPPLPPGISPQLVYPGAEMTTNLIQPDGGSQLHLRTKDAPARVADWYAARVDPIQTIKSPDGTTILQFAGGQVIIRPEGSGATIFIMHHAG